MCKYYLTIFLVFFILAFFGIFMVMIPKLKLGERDDGNIGLKHDGFRAIGVGDCLYRLIMRWAAV